MDSLVNFGIYFLMIGASVVLLTLPTRDQIQGIKVKSKFSSTPMGIILMISLFIGFIRAASAFV